MIFVNGVVYAFTLSCKMNTQFAMSADFVCCNHVYYFFVVNGLYSLSLNIQFSLNYFVYL